MTSLPALTSAKVATGDDGVIPGKRVKRFVDLSTTGPRAAIEIAESLKRKASCRSTAR